MSLLYALTLLLNALLLFLVQPMVAKMLLPYLGGTPSVWNTCMLFFQMLLLAGYTYSHFITTQLRFRPQIILHLALVILATAFLPLTLPETAARALNGQVPPVAWMLWHLLLLVGLPFLMLASGGPLLQKWFSQTNNPVAGDPYFLYSVSNFGSLLALLIYPVLMEPTLRLRQQSWFWAGSYVTLIFCVLACAVVRWRAGEGGKTKTHDIMNIAPPLALQRRLYWVAMAFVPSSLMLGVTTFLSTDISPIPLLWIVPLGLYLLSFILAFARTSHRWLTPVSRLMVFVALVLIESIQAELRLPLWLILTLNLVFFFSAALVGHTRLAQDRPPAARLTEFYFWLAVGGMLGGVFNSLLAPALFHTLAEYPLAIILTLVLPLPLKKVRAQTTNRWFDLLWPLGAGALIMGFVLALPQLGLIDHPMLIYFFALMLPGVVAIIWFVFPFRFALVIGIVFFGISPYLVKINNNRILLAERNFFGTLRVIEDFAGKFRLLLYGTTLHGRQYLDEQRRCEPLSYFHWQGPVGQAMRAFAAQPAAPNIAVVGLGTGTMAAYARAGERWTFYEINPAVLALTARGEYFTYLSKCAAAPVNTILGDARLQLTHAPDGYYGLIVLDAFNSDAVPTHLLTQEAMRLYLSKLAPGGRLLFHISNRYLDLQSVVIGVAQNLGLVCLASIDIPPQQNSLAEGQEMAHWMALARTERDLGSLLRYWQRIRPYSHGKIWTDDYSNVLNILIWLNR